VKNLLALTLMIAASATGAFAQGSAAQPAAWSRTLAAPQDRGPAVERGAAVFNNWCSACHGKDPRNAPGTASLQFKYQGRTPAALEDRRDLTPQAIKLYVRQGVATMPFSRPTEVSNVDLEALIAYLTQPKPQPSAERK
jgi:mono/diheme cytochrome c family protein